MMIGNNETACFKIANNDFFNLKESNQIILVKGKEIVPSHGSLSRTNLLTFFKSYNAMPNNRKFGSVYLTIFFCFVLIVSCQNPNTLQSIPLKHLQSFPISVKRPAGYEKGKRFPDAQWNDVYLLNQSAKTTESTPDDALENALEHNQKLFKRRKLKKQYQIGNLKIAKQDIEQVTHILLNSELPFWETIIEEFDTYQINGKDRKGNVYFTGYYTPIVKVNDQSTAKYSYPLYGKPDRQDWAGRLPSRSQIDGEGALIGKGLELAFAKSLADIYYMQLQGSGIIEYPNGDQEYLSFTGTNGHSYRSIEKYVVQNTAYKVKDISEEGMKRFFTENPDLEEPILFTNPSYVFFDRKRKRPHGAGHVPLTNGISIAVDNKYIPLGSVLIAALPIIGEKGRVYNHTYKILLAQDLGGAIRGSGHVDLYYGTGKQGRQQAMSMHHYGQLWLLLPKERSDINGSLSM